MRESTFIITNRIVNHGQWAMGGDRIVDREFSYELKKGVHVYTWINVPENMQVILPKDTFITKSKEEYTDKDLVGWVRDLQGDFEDMVEDYTEKIDKVVSKLNKEGMVDVLKVISKYRVYSPKHYVISELRQCIQENKGNYYKLRKLKIMYKCF